MTHKDYELIAAAIDRARAAIVRESHGTQRDHRLAGTYRSALALSHALAATNDRFDRERFLDAAIAGPQYREAVNAENLARELGPGRLTSGVEGD